MAEHRTFSQRVCEELVHESTDRDCCILAELSALTQTSGSLGFLGGGRFSVTYQVESLQLARRIYRMLKQGLSLSPSLHVVEHHRLGGQKTCVITVDGEDAPRLLNDLSMMSTSPDGTMTLRRMTPHVSLSRQCCRKSFLRGAFLGCGSMTGPEKSYHMEWVTGEENLTTAVRKMLERNGIEAHATERRGRTVVYLKNAQAIVDVLALMGAHAAVMEMENIRITKQVRGNANRASNCDEHNTERMLNASERQMRAIRKITLQHGLASLPPALRQMARLRLEQPELSLEELGKQLDPPIGKSGVSHRLARLEKIAETIPEEEEDT
ncbi:MAG: DNA-binding protein WhiA [Clostridia bacterium]|nr:DNA-binding protein WhiA [Clostridia bacterium]